MMKYVVRFVFTLLISAAWLGCGGADDDGLCKYDAAGGFDTSDCSVEGLQDAVVLNEFSSAGNDEIELFNHSDSPVNLGGWLLTDGVEAQRIDTYDPVSDAEKFVFPTGTVIAAGAYLVIPKGNEDLSHPFGIAKKGDILSLVSPNGKLVDQSTYSDSQAVPSYCRVPDGTGTWQTCENTFGSSNEALRCGNGTLDEGEQCDGSEFGDATCESVSTIFSGGDLGCSTSCTFNVRSCSSDAPCDADKLVLNEVCHKDADCGVADITTGDWLEIHNPSDSSAELSGCYIRVVDQGELQLQTLVGWIPGYQAATVEPGGFWLLSGVPTLFSAGKDEVVSLLDADQAAINSLVTSSALSIDGDSESTTCRIDDGTVTPTPAAANSCGL